jgi:hypothetical protein
MWSVECGMVALGARLPTPPNARMRIASRRFLAHESHESHQLFATGAALLLKASSCFSICSSPTIGARQLVPLQWYSVG